jgi:hypothetical protein
VIQRVRVGGDRDGAGRATMTVTARGAAPADEAGDSETVRPAAGACPEGLSKLQSSYSRPPGPASQAHRDWPGRFKPELPTAISFSIEARSRSRVRVKENKYKAQRPHWQQQQPIYSLKTTKIHQFSRCLMHSVARDSGSAMIGDEPAAAGRARPAVRAARRAGLRSY